jgi:hypothetical protein
MGLLFLGSRGEFAGDGYVDVYMLREGESRYHKSHHASEEGTGEE